MGWGESDRHGKIFESLHRRDETWVDSWNWTNELLLKGQIGEWVFQRERTMSRPGMERELKKFRMVWHRVNNGEGHGGDEEMWGWIGSQGWDHTWSICMIPKPSPTVPWSASEEPGRGRVHDRVSTRLRNVRREAGRHKCLSSWMTYVTLRSTLPDCLV